MNWRRFAVDDVYCDMVGSERGLSVVWVPLKKGGGL